MHKRKLVLAFANLVPAILVIILAYTNFLRFWATGGEWRLSHLLLVFQLVLAGFFFIARQPPTQVSWRPWDVLIALLGTFAPSFFSFENKESSRISGLILQIVGDGLSIYAIISLGRSIGILPAHRGIQRGGLYRFVRHPMYASFQIANLGFLINHPGIYNLAVALLCLLSQVLRIFAEERLLESDPEYVKYKRRVRWRLIPFIF